MADIATLGLATRYQDIEGANRALTRFSGAAGQAEKSARRMGDGATNAARRAVAANDNVARSANRLAGVYRRVGAIIGAAIVGAFSAVSLRQFIKATVENDKAQAQLAAAITSTGAAAGRSVRQLNAHAAALQKVTSFGDEVINTAQGILLTFTRIRGDQFDNATNAVLDLATAMNMDLKSAAIQVGKALNDPVVGMTALQRSGITFTESQKEMVKQLVASGQMVKAQTVILKELETQFGGSAKAARDTLGGALASLRNAWGDLFELGREKSEVLRLAIERLITAITHPAFVNFVQTIGVLLVQAFASLIEKIADLVQGSNLHDFIRNATSLATQAAGAIRGMTAEITGLAEAIRLIGEGEFRKARDAWNAGQQEFLRIQAETKKAVDDIWAAPAPGTALGANKGDFGPPDPMQMAPVETSLGGVDKAAKKAADSYAKLVDGAKKFIAEQELERRSIGMTEEAANRLRYEFDLLNKAREAGIKLTDEQRRELAGLASAMAAAEAQTNALRDAYESVQQAIADTIDFAKDLTKGFVNDMRRGLEQGKSMWRSFADAAINAMNRIGDKLVDLGIDMAFSGMTSGGTGAASAGGGIFGAIGKLFGFAGGGHPGGRVSGPGTSTSDSIVTMLSNGPAKVSDTEYIVNARSTRKFLPLLEAVNDNDPSRIIDNIPGFWMGGNASMGADTGVGGGGGHPGTSGNAAGDHGGASSGGTSGGTSGGMGGAAGSTGGTDGMGGATGGMGTDSSGGGMGGGMGGHPGMTGNAAGDFGGGMGVNGAIGGFGGSTGHPGMVGNAAGDRGIASPGTASQGNKGNFGGPASVAPGMFDSIVDAMRGFPAGVVAAMTPNPEKMQDRLFSSVNKMQDRIAVPNRARARVDAAMAELLGIAMGNVANTPQSRTGMAATIAAMNRNAVPSNSFAGFSLGDITSSPTSTKGDRGKLGTRMGMPAEEPMGVLSDQLGSTHSKGFQGDFAARTAARDQMLAEHHAANLAAMAQRAAVARDMEVGPPGRPSRGLGLGFGPAPSLGFPDTARGTNDPETGIAGALASMSADPVPSNAFDGFTSTVASRPGTTSPSPTVSPPSTPASPFSGFDDVIDDVFDGLARADAWGRGQNAMLGFQQSRVGGVGGGVERFTGDGASTAAGAAINPSLFATRDEYLAWFHGRGFSEGGFAGYFARGGRIPAGQWGIAGEAGPEPVVGPATVLPNSAMGGGDAPEINIRSGDIIIQGNADEKTLPMIRREIAASEARMQKDLANNLGQYQGRWSTFKGQ